MALDYVIIGNGVAGIQAAETIRRLDRTGHITLIGDETHLPYCRPMISMALEGTIDFPALTIRGPDFYEANAITPILGERVAAIDVDGRAVIIGGGRRVPFHRLLIATGADPRPVAAAGLDLNNIHYMRSQDHVRRMLASIDGARRATVLGGGLVGFKAACGLLRRGVGVSLLIGSGHPLSMQVDDEAGAMLLAELRRRGLDVRVGAAVAGFEGENGRVRSAALKDGGRVDCDLVVIGKGVRPALDFVPRDRIPVDLGILVDARMETGAPGIYAAGDVAEAEDIARRTRWVNAIWPEAVEQGRVAGMNMAGRQVAYPGSLSRNVIRVFDMDAMTAGVVTPDDDGLYEVIRERDAGGRLYRKLVFREDRLVGFTLINRIEQGGVMTALIRSRLPIRVSRRRLLAPDFNWSLLLP